jgi:hypothetical protein
VTSQLCVCGAEPLTRVVALPLVIAVRDQPAVSGSAPCVVTHGPWRDGHMCAAWPYGLLLLCPFLFVLFNSRNPSNEFFCVNNASSESGL